MILSYALAILALQTPATAVNVVGRVEMRVGGNTTPLVRFAEVPDAATVITHQDAFASLRLASGSLVRMGPETQLVINRLDSGNPAGRRRESMAVKVGHIWAGVLRLIGQDSSFEVETANAVAGVRGTSFFVSATEQGSSFVADAGSVVVTVGGQQLALDAVGASVDVGPGGLGRLSHLDGLALRALRQRAGGARAIFGGSYPGFAFTVDGHGAAREAWRHELLGPDAFADTPAAAPTAWSPTPAATNLNIRTHLPSAASP